MTESDASLLKFWRDRPVLTRIALILFIVAMGLMLIIMIYGIGWVVHDIATNS